MREFAADNQRRLRLWLDDNEHMDLGGPHRDRILTAPESFPKIKVYRRQNSVAQWDPPECKVWWYSENKPDDVEENTDVEAIPGPSVFGVGRPT